MPRKPPSATPLSLPAELIPDTALLPNLALGTEALALRDTLSLALERAGFAPIDSYSFCTRVLNAFCEDGTVHGSAVHPPHGPIKTEKGQRRRVHAASQPIRERSDQPILVLVARMFIQDGLETIHAGDIVRVAAERALGTISTTVQELSQDAHWKPLLTRVPDFHCHRIFELHYETNGYPSYPYFAADLHYGLIARLAQLQAAPEEKREHALRTTITAPKALIPVIPKDWLPEHPEELDSQQARAILEQAAERLEGIEPATRADYVGKFLDLLESGAARRPYHVRGTRSARRHLSPSLSKDIDEEIERESLLEAQLAALAQGFELDDASDFSVDSTLASQVLAELEGLGPSDKRRQARFIRQRIVLDRNRTIYSPGVIPLHELAAYYAALSPKPNSNAPVGIWQILTRLVFLDFLVHTGRPPEWIAAIQVGNAPDLPCRGEPPVYDPARGVIAYTPDAYPTIPEWLQPPASALADEIAAWRFRVRQHDAAYEPISFVYELPLSSVQQALVGKLMCAKDSAFAALGIQAPSSDGLFLVIENNHIRCWNEADTSQLLLDLTDYVRRLHPAWGKVTAPRFEKSFKPHFCTTHGLDPVYATYISARVEDSLARPVHYSYVRLNLLSRQYFRAQADFREAIEREHALTANVHTPALPWSDLPPNGVEPKSDAGFGSWRCPRRRILRQIFAALEQMTDEPDAQTSYNARVAFCALRLGIGTGLRPFELTDILRRAVDLPHKTIALSGKPNPAFETHRQVPIPDSFMEPIRLLVNKDEDRWSPKDDAYLFRVYENGTKVAAAVHHMESIWQEAGMRAGLEKEQIPDLYGLRHFFRSRALELNFPLTTINALMGHQVAGCELYNPYLGHDAKLVFEQGRQIAAGIFSELESKEQVVEGES